MHAPNRMNIGSRIVLACLLFVLSLLSPVPMHAAAFLIDIPVPPGSWRFGEFCDGAEQRQFCRHRRWLQLE